MHGYCNGDVVATVEGLERACIGMLDLDFSFCFAPYHEENG